MIRATLSVIFCSFLRMPVVLGLLLGSVSYAQESRYDDAESIGQLPDQVHESSGLGASRRGDFLWTHNDSGDHANLYAVDYQGNLKTTCRIKGIRAVDWEDMACFERKGKPCILVGDVGDNLHRRSNLQLHLIEEPREDQSSTEVVQTIIFKFGSGSEDCESVAYDPINDVIFVATKGWRANAKIYSFDFPTQPNDEPIVAELVAATSLAAITGMDISSDGRRAILVTYGNAYEFSRGPNESWSDAFGRKGREVALPPRKQGEAICYSPQGDCLFTTSEKKPAPLIRLRRSSELIGSTPDRDTDHDHDKSTHDSP